MRMAICELLSSFEFWIKCEIFAISLMVFNLVRRRLATEICKKLTIQRKHLQARGPDPHHSVLPVRWDGEDARRLPSFILSHSPTEPAAHRKAVSLGSSYKQSQKSANVYRCHFSNLPPPTGSPAPFRQAHFHQRRMPVGLKRLQAGGAGVVMEGAGREAEPLLAELASSRNLNSAGRGRAAVSGRSLELSPALRDFCQRLERFGVRAEEQNQAEEISLNSG
ncbi:uncharacterized protein LOC116559966 [Sapajus apella]|uniref:Uncharacterized protein LOC116559966 n=1 Tax=Sapajus apella TaxID=9515 RepID=A0A6J3IYE5_SAPAP|nr:uncharacterized protein LOC116559966 [Sapajus apella]